MKKAKALPILMYHHISPNPGLVTVSPTAFRSQIEALARDGWGTVGLKDAERFFLGESLPPKTCIVTFDDGYLDNRTYAAPVLAEFGMKAVIFVVTGWLGEGVPRTGTPDAPDHSECKRRIAAGEPDSVILRWSEAEQLQAAGVFEFHSHTHSHTRWDRQVVELNARGRALAEDLVASRQALRGRLGVDSRHLCWPQGYYDEQYMALACAAGFDYLYTTQTRINVAGSPTNQIGRFVTKEKPGRWLRSRTALYARPWLGRLYSYFKD